MLNDNFRSSVDHKTRNTMRIVKNYERFFVADAINIPKSRTQNLFDPDSRIYFLRIPDPAKVFIPEIPFIFLMFSRIPHQKKG